MHRTRRAKAFGGAVLGLALGAALGWLAGWLVRSDNAPLFVALGGLMGIWVGLAWSRLLRPRVLGVGGLLALLLLAVIATPPRVPFQPVNPAPAALAPPTPGLDGLTPNQVATLSSLQRVDDYPLYTMHYVGEARQASEASPVSAPRSFACSLFAALGDPENRLYGRNFDWRYSPALLLFTGRPAAGGYASVSMVDIEYLGFGDRAADLTALPLTERRSLLAAPSWPFDGMNEAGVAVAMAAVPAADERRDPGKPAIGSLGVIRAILDRAGSADEAVAILSGYNISWEGGPPLHYLVADRSGRAALVEFHAGQIAVLANAGPWHAATNFTLDAVAGDATGQCWRYDAIIRRLQAVHGALSSRDALSLLQAAAQTESATQWSVVYGMSSGQVEVVMGRQDAQVHTFRLGP